MKYLANKYDEQTNKQHDNFWFHTISVVLVSACEEEKYADWKL